MCVARLLFVWQQWCSDRRNSKSFFCSAISNDMWKDYRVWAVYRIWRLQGLPQHQHTDNWQLTGSIRSSGDAVDFLSSISRMRWETPQPTALCMWCSTTTGPSFLPHLASKPLTAFSPLFSLSKLKTQDLVFHTFSLSAPVRNSNSRIKTSRQTHRLQVNSLLFCIQLYHNDTKMISY